MHIMRQAYYGSPGVRLNKSTVMKDRDGVVMGCDAFCKCFVDGQESTDKDKLASSSVLLCRFVGITARPSAAHHLVTKALCN